MFIDHKNLVLGRLDQIKLYNLETPVDLKVAGYIGPIRIFSDEFLLADVENPDWVWSQHIDCDFDGSFLEKSFVVKSNIQSTGYVKVQKL